MVDKNTEMLKEINDDIEEDESNKNDNLLEEQPTPSKLTSKPITNPTDYPANRDTPLPQQEKQNK